MFAPGLLLDDQQSADPETYIRTSIGVYVSSRYRSQKLASVPLKFYSGTGTKRRLIEQGSLVEVFSQVNPYWTARRLMEMTELSLCIWGKNFWFMSLGKNGEPEEIWWAKPSQVKVVRSNSDYVSHFEYDLGSGKPLQFSKEETFWLRYPNVIDQFDGMAPLVAAALSADIGTNSLKSNAQMFTQGMQMAGFVAPPEGTSWNKEIGDQVEASLKERFAGKGKAHRWVVLQKSMKFMPLSLTPKDAEYLSAIKMSFEDIGRAYGLSPDLLGGERTYANAAEARLAFWQDTMLPECAFIADELTEQILPRFGKQADSAEFDTSGVDVLQEVQDAKWARWKEQITLGARTINEERLNSGLDPVPWGDPYWKPLMLEPVTSKEQVDKWQELQPVESPKPPKATDPIPPPIEDMPMDGNMPKEPSAKTPAKDATSEAHILRAARRATNRAISEYGSPEHQRMWRAFVRQLQPWENKLGSQCEDFFRRQRKSIIAKLKDERNIRAKEDVANDPFDLKRWAQLMRETVRPTITALVEEVGATAVDQIAAGLSFDVENPAIVRFLERRTQRFAKQVNETTWNSLKESLGEGITNGEKLDELIARVETVMAGRISSSAETIARTEVVGAANGGTLEAWKQTEVVRGKQWVASLDDRTRDSHVEAHGQTVALDDDFEVGDGNGPCPSSIVSCCPNISIVS
jgi:HK97 family phage portal protein